MKYIAPIFLVCSMGLFLASVALPAFCAGCTEREGQICYPYTGIFLLFCGWFGALATGWHAGLTWLANPLLIMAWILQIAWITTRFPTRVFVVLVVSFALSALAAIFSASFLLLHKIETNPLAGGFTELIHIRHLGYWLWFSSTIMMFVGNCIQMIVLAFNKSVCHGTK